MALSDYIPQIFGSAPQGYQGLLGEEQTTALQKQANLQGLLSSAVALAQGMSAQGPRRSAAQNILGALASGFGTAGQAYQQGLQNYSMQQQLAMQQQQKAGAERLKLQYPDLAQMIDTNLPGAMRIIADIEQEKRQPKLTAVKPDEVLVGPGGNVVYTASKSAEKSAKILTKEEAAAMNLPSGVWQVDANGKISPIEGTVVKPIGLTGEYANVAATMFPQKDVSQLTAAELSQVRKEVNLSKSAAAPKLSVNVGEKKFVEEFGKGVAEAVNTTYNNAVGAQNTLNTIATIKPLIEQGVYAGPISSAPIRTIDQMASSFGYASGTTEQKLARTAEAMQGLASLELSAAQGMKGQGPITDNERGLIRRAAAGDFTTFTQKEVLTLLNALEKTSKYKLQVHNTNLERLKKNEQTKGIAEFYEINKVREFDPATGKLKD